MLAVKIQIIEQLINSLEGNLTAAIQAYQEYKANAQDDEMRSESKWDTRGIEAGYLASAQERRTKELEIELLQIKQLKVRNFCPDEEIAVGALIQLESSDKLYFIAPSTGGHTLSIDNKEIQILSINSPMGSAMLGLEVGDDFKFNSPLGPLEYFVKSVY